MDFKQEMSEFSHINTEKLRRDFEDLHAEWAAGVPEKRLAKRYQYLRNLSETLYRVATRESQPHDKQLLEKLLEVVKQRQKGLVTKRQAEERFGNDLGGVFIEPVKEKLAQNENGTSGAD